jgi:VanZ family protein
MAVGQTDEGPFRVDPDRGGFVLFVRCTRIIAWLLLALIMVLTLVPPAFRPETSVSHTMEHAAIFLTTGLAFGTGYGRRGALPYIAAILFCAALEIAQLFDPGRHARMSDFFIDFSVMWLGLCLGAPLFKSRSR